MKAFVLALSVLAASATIGRATVTINLGGGTLYDQNGTPFSNSGVIMLVASTTDSIFSAPDPGAGLTAGSFLAGDDVILASFAAGDNGTFQQEVNINFSAFANLNAGDLLQLYWFPTLNNGINSTVGQNTPYGDYRTDQVSSGSDIAWVMPQDGSTSFLFFINQGTDSDSPIPASEGVANLTTVPEPSTTALFLGAISGAALWVRRRFSRTPVAAV
jgi:hypothetical protein